MKYIIDMTLKLANQKTKRRIRIHREAKFKKNKVTDKEKCKIC